ncbi:hypothetical protein KKG83_03145 [Candidatus Micrarchaeota archaeon]|nr:hypothetical protein [Candidatus Micrarchaeota archaeon]
MAWTIVETPNAKYILVFGAHDRRNIPPPAKFDALILETPIEHAFYSDYLGYTPNLDRIDMINKAVAENKQIWLTDVNLTKKSHQDYEQKKLKMPEIREKTVKKIIAGSGLLSLISSLLYVKKKVNNKMNRRKFIKKAAISVAILAVPPIVATPIANKIIYNLNINDGEIRVPILWDLTTQLDKILYGEEALKGIVTIRNAITAQKAEAFLAPKLKQELNRKPVIAMVWGAGHYEIKRLLKHPNERYRILKKNKLEDYVQKDYPKSYRVQFNEKGQITRTKEFKETLKIPETPKKRITRGSGNTKISRREFFRTMIRRRV